MKLFIVVLLSLFSVNSFSIGSVYPSYTDRAQRGVIELDYEGTYFISSGQYDEEGNNTELTSDESFSFFQSDALLRYGYSDSLEFGAGFRFRFIMADFFNGTEDISASKSGLESYLLSARYLLSKGKTSHWLAFVTIRQSAYSNTDYVNVTSVPEDEISLGDNGTEFDVGMAWDYYFSKTHFVHNKLSYRKPGNSLSEEVVYDLESVWRTKNWGISIGLDGIYSLQSDSFGGQSELKPVQGRAPSTMFNSTNRSYNAVGFGLSTGLGNWTISGKYKAIVSGQSTDSGQKFIIGLSRFADKKRRSNKNNIFKDYDLEADVVKVSAKGNFVRINKGLNDDVVRGMRFDLYKNDFKGLNELVAEGVVYKIFSNAAVLKIVNRFSSRKVGNGFIARSQL
jgi:hypothetical protein